LFADPPQKEDCDICMIPIPYTSGIGGVETIYQTCCGKTLCYGCMLSTYIEIHKGKMKSCCPFCRLSIAEDNKVNIDRCNKRIELNDAEAFTSLGSQYKDGSMGLPRDMSKAIELWKQGANLGSNDANQNLAVAYMRGEG